MTIGEVFINYDAWTVTEITDKGDVNTYPITNCFDSYGEECAPTDGLIDVIVAGAGSRWLTLPYERVRKPS